MSDLIKREDAIKAINKALDRETLLNRLVRKVVLDAIISVSSADRPQGEWIPCSERLPNEKEIVLITNDKGNVRFGQFRGTHGKYWIWKGNTLETVLAWMPLPEPWKGADDE